MNLEIEALKQTVVELSLEVAQAKIDLNVARKQIESLESELKGDKQNEVDE